MNKIPVSHPTRKERRRERRERNKRARLAFQHPNHRDSEGKPLKVFGCPRCEEVME